MGRVNSKTLKHNRLIAATAEAAIISENNARKRAAALAEREQSVDYQMELAQRKCIQPLHKLEQEWDKAVKAKTPNNEKIGSAREHILRGLDKAAADSIARIMAEIKQFYLATKNISLKELQIVNLSVDQFYADFERFCDKEFKNYKIDEEEFNKIAKVFNKQNLLRLNSLGERVGYTKPAEQYVKNLEIIKNLAVKEKDLSL